MIEIKDVSKTFGVVKALDHVDGRVKEGRVFGLVGTNGSGKSTCLRMMAGVLKPDTGSVLVDGEEIYENADMKKEIFFISDDQYFFAGASAKDMENFYAIHYPKFDHERFHVLMSHFNLDLGRPIHTYSKGMKKQLSVLLGVCAGTKYLFCDESFDGLDPVMRKAVKRIFIEEITSRDFTPVISSHNLRELEDICDHVGLLHKGEFLLSRDLDELKENTFKIQCLMDEEQERTFTRNVHVILKEVRGSLLTFTVRGSREKIVEAIEACKPSFWELLPLTLEEIFISETEVAGYDVQTLLQ